MNYYLQVYLSFLKHNIVIHLNLYDVIMKNLKVMKIYSEDSRLKKPFCSQLVYSFGIKLSEFHKYHYTGIGLS